MERKFEVTPDWKLTPEIKNWMVIVYEEVIDSCLPPTSGLMKRQMDQFVYGSEKYQRTEIEEYCLDLANDNPVFYDDLEVIRKVIKPI
jgi:hypothetical protein